MKTIKVCTVCGFKIESDGDIERCLKCGADTSKFKQLSDEETKKIYESDRTNDIHCELIKLSMKMTNLCEEGLSIGLDNPCKEIFGWTKDRSWDIKQLCKSEIQSHINKGKW